MKLSDKVKGLIGAVAPTLGAAFGGPMGGVAGKFIADALTGGDTSKVEEVLATANPDTLLKLKTLDKEFQLKMKEADIDVFKLEVQDTSNAREMAKTSGAWPQIGLSGAYTAGYFGLLYMLLSGDVSIAPDIGRQIDVLFGVMTAAQIQIMNFWFGSSRGSAMKTEQMHKLIK